MTEEERRTRTRHLPDVEGFRVLSKNECKADLVKLAKSWDFANQQGADDEGAGTSSSGSNAMDVEHASDRSSSFVKTGPLTVLDGAVNALWRARGILSGEAVRTLTRSRLFRK